MQNLAKSDTYLRFPESTDVFPPRPPQASLCSEVFVFTSDFSFHT